MRRGFTLIELIIAGTIAAMIAGTLANVITLLMIVGLPMKP